MKNNKFNRIIIIIVSLIIIVLTLLFFFSNKKEFSENENRNLADFPKFTVEKLFEGEYIPDLTSYLVDHFPFRDNFMSLKTMFFKAIGKTHINGVYLGNDGYLLEEYTAQKEEMDRLYKALNEFNQKIPKSTKVSLMLAPTSVEIMSENLPKYASNTSQKKVIDYIYDNIDFNTINVYDVLERASKEREVYYKTDHHWNTYGAYLAGVTYDVENGGQSIFPYEAEKINDNFYGTLYSKVIDNSLEKDEIYKLKDKDYIEYRVRDVAKNTVTDTLYEEKWLDEKDKYSYFLGQNQPLLEIKNISINTQKSILIIKDSYANAVIPYLAENYENVYVIDPRYYKYSISDYAKEKEVDEILFLYNIKTLETDKDILLIK